MKNPLDDELSEAENYNDHPQTERGKRKIKERFLHGEYMGKKV